MPPNITFFGNSTYDDHAGFFSPTTTYWIISLAACAAGGAILICIYNSCRNWHRNRMQEDQPQIEMQDNEQQVPRINLSSNP